MLKFLWPRRYLGSLAHGQVKVHGGLVEDQVAGLNR
jgi:hypothetical protein